MKFNFNRKQLLKAENLALAEHVRDVEEHRRNNESFLIKCRVIRQASVHSTPYITSLNINSERHVTLVHCNCVYNKSEKCKHVAALIYFINNEESFSKTSREQQWGKPSARQFAKNKYSKGKYFKNMVSHEYIQLHEPKKFLVTDLKVDSRLKQIMEAQLKKDNEHTVRNIVNSLITQVELNLEREENAACIENLLIFSEQYFVYKSHYDLDRKIKQFYVENVLLSEEEIITLSCETVKQSLNKSWYNARRLRISASCNVHNIKVLSRKPVEALISEMLNPRKISTASTRYGLKMETYAKDQYQEWTNSIVKRLGVMVCKLQPWLCASLDGVVTDDSCISKIIEFKCPSSCEKKPILNLVDKSSNVKYLKFINNKFELKKTHIYYTQVQVQMYVSGMSVCDLFVYSPVKNGSCLIEVHRDEEFLEAVIFKSEKFYFEHYLPALYTTIATGDSVKENINNNDNQNYNLDMNIKK